MGEGRAFQVALLVSVLAHSIFFIGLPHMPFSPSRRSLESLKITYYKLKEEPIKKKLIGIKPEAIIRKLPKIQKEEILKPPKTPSKKVKKPAKKIERVTVAKEVKEKSFEVVVEEEEDDVKKATYISYYRSVREKIRLYADRNYPRYRNLAEGEVFLTFIVASSGELLQVRVVDEKSVNNRILRNIAINSLRDASPFPPFPQGMNQYQITFNVIISFENK